MSSPVISVAGIRGIVGDSLVPEAFLKYVMAYASTLKGDMVVVGGDTRLSKNMVRQLVFAGLSSSGINIIDLGVCPTPTVGLMVRECGAAGGIAITASHNPAQWNALKFFSDEGVFLTQTQFNRVMDAYEQEKFIRAPYTKIGRREILADPLGAHLATLFKFIDTRAIRRRKLKVIIDCCNGAGALLAPRLAKGLGISAELIFDNTEIEFERTPEPLPENLEPLRQAVLSNGADVGFAMDPDADRLALVDNMGRAIGEERTLTLCADHWLSREPAPVVTNLSTTRALDDVAKSHGVKLHRTPIGEAHVVEKMKKVDARIGGEGNGGVILMRSHPGRDAGIGIALICDMIGQRKQTLSEINAEIPDYVMVKRKIDRNASDDVDKILKTVEKGMPPAESVIKADGLKLEYKDAWVHIRPSGTEPILRIFAEARSEEAADQWVEQVRASL